MAAAVVEPGLDSGITTSAWQSYIENVQPDHDDDVDSDEEEEICNIFEGPPEPERDALADALGAESNMEITNRSSWNCGLS